jgi:hypothetical protein
MSELDIFKKLEDFDSIINNNKEIIRYIKNERVEWCRKNREKIKSLFPKKGKIYEIIDLDVYSRVFDIIYGLTNNSKIYFKPKNLRFDLRHQFQHYSEIYPSVKGDILNENLIKLNSYDVEISIKNLKGINDKLLNKAENSFTKVYVMIDKNTGYYKIGRSIKPLYRERTLQSEKPTIEMLFNYDARIKDERKLHNIFKDKNVRGEWYNLDGTDLQKIKKYFNNQQKQIK